VNSKVAVNEEVAAASDVPTKGCDEENKSEELALHLGLSPRSATDSCSSNPTVHATVGLGFMTQLFVTMV
jgi:hypothetical protein